MSSVVDRLFTEARVYLSGGHLLEGWIAVKDGRVESVGEGVPPPSRLEVACHGRLVLPGLIDMHVHFRDPGYTYKEDFQSGSTAAAFGGVTTVVDMPNTEGLVITPGDVERKLSVIEGRSYVDYGLYGLLADSAPHMAGLRQLGIAGLKWLIGYHEQEGRLAKPSSSPALRDALTRAAELGVQIGVHAESYTWLDDLRNELQQRGRTDALAHCDSRPPFVEALGVAEACILTAEFGCRLHVHHLSSDQGLRTAIAMRERLGTRVTVETCPQYLFLTDDDVRKLGSRTRVNPPIRTQTDVDALWAGIQNYEVDCVATDHAPHTIEQKEASNIWEGESGLLGVETLFPMLFHEVSTGRLSLQRFVELTAERPAALVGMSSRKGSLLPGQDADLVIVDPDQTTLISGARLHSKHPITVYEGRERRGAITGVYLRGEPLAVDGQLAERPFGRFVPRQYDA
jgi:allantoinase